MKNEILQVMPDTPVAFRLLGSCISGPHQRKKHYELDVTSNLPDIFQNQCLWTPSNLNPVTILQSTNPTPHQPSLRIENPRQPPRHTDRQIPICINRIHPTAPHLYNLRPRRETSLTPRQIQRITPSIRSQIRKHANDLFPRETLAHYDGRAIGVDWVRFVCYVGAVFVNCLVADLVDDADEYVEWGGGAVAWVPDCVTIVRDVATVIVLFLAFVDCGLLAKHSDLH